MLPTHVCSVQDVAIGQPSSATKNRESKQDTVIDCTCILSSFNNQHLLAEAVRQGSHDSSNERNSMHVLQRVLNAELLEYCCLTNPRGVDQIGSRTSTAAPLQRVLDKRNPLGNDYDPTYALALLPIACPWPRHSPNSQHDHEDEDQTHSVPV